MKNVMDVRVMLLIVNNALIQIKILIKIATNVLVLKQFQVQMEVVFVRKLDNLMMEVVHAKHVHINVMLAVD